jgi:D-glycero-D-manno-heptose 1,7-bisphosphate phosphatase
MDTCKWVALLDRDGTIIIERNYLADPNAVELLPNAAAGLRKLCELGFRLVIVTNQSGVGRGYFTLETVAEVHEKLLHDLSVEGITIDAVFFCPHTPEDNCMCRKPKPGLAKLAASALGFDLRHTVVIGDKPCDVELARCIGARAVLVTTGYGAKYAGTLHPDIIAADLADAADQLQRLQETRL